MNKIAIDSVNARFITCLNATKKIFRECNHQTEDEISIARCASMLLKMVTSYPTLRHAADQKLSSILDRALTNAMETYTKEVAKIEELPRSMRNAARESIVAIAESIIVEMQESR